MPAVSVNPAACAALQIAACMCVLGSSATYFVTWAGSRYLALWPWPWGDERAQGCTLGLTCADVEDDAVCVVCDEGSFELDVVFIDASAKGIPDMGKEEAGDVSWVEEQGRSSPYVPKSGPKGDCECDVDVLERAESGHGH